MTDEKANEKASENTSVKTDSEPNLIGKDSNKWSLTSIARNYRHSKRIAKYAGGTILVAGGAALALPFLGIVMLFGLALGAVAFLATILLTVNKIRSMKDAPGIIGMAAQAASSAASKAAADAKAGPTVEVSEPEQKPYVLWDAGAGVCVFGIEPTMQEILKANNTSSSAPGLVRIPNGSKAFVLFDESRDAVKVKISGGEHNGHVGWVSRSCLVSAEREAV